MPIRTDVPALVDYLNLLVSIDREAMQRLIETRVPCNHSLAGHPTVQVALEMAGPVVGLLGLLNGWAGAYDDGPRQGWGPIGAIFENGRLVGFTILPNDG